MIKNPPTNDFGGMRVDDDVNGFSFKLLGGLFRVIKAEYIIPAGLKGIQPNRTPTLRRVYLSGGKDDVKRLKRCRSIGLGDIQIGIERMIDFMVEHQHRAGQPDDGKKKT